LVCNQQEEASAREALQQLPERLQGLLELRVAHGDGVALVRPDGYAAHAGRDRSGPRLAETIEPCSSAKCADGRVRTERPYCDVTRPAIQSGSRI
jgi:hypothetical protein